MTKWTTITSQVAGDITNLDAYWIIAADLTDLPDPIGDCDHIRIAATGSWELLSGWTERCGPDGLINAPIASEALLLSSCAPGTLVGKIGGSSAQLDSAVAGDAGEGAEKPSSIFAIGKDCVVRIKDLPKGSLFVGINLKLRPLKVEKLTLTIEGAVLG